jgi:hypothetical protein
LSLLQEVHDVLDEERSGRPASLTGK